MAAALIILVPAVILTWAVQKDFAKGITIGTAKGWLQKFTIGN